jgi:methanogenic corrinoid protein MtbC1
MDKVSKHLFRSALLDLKQSEAQDIFKQAIDSHGVVEAAQLYITDTLSEFGQEWENGDLALSQLYMSARLVEDICLTLFDQKHENTELSPVGMTTLGDFHLLGKRIVLSVLRSSGWVIQDLGQTGSVPELLQKIEKTKIKYLLVSTLMLPSALLVGQLTTAIQERGLDVKVMVGGAPFNFDENLFIRVGADKMGKSPKDVISQLEKWCPEVYKPQISSH